MKQNRKRGQRKDREGEANRESRFVVGGIQQSKEKKGGWQEGGRKGIRGI